MQIQTIVNKNSYPPSTLLLHYIAYYVQAYFIFFPFALLHFSDTVYFTN